MSSTLKLIAGLGNPGPDYIKTRHNAGFWFVDQLADNLATHFSIASRFHGDLARVQSGDMDCRLLKPTTYMNASGRAIRAMADYLNIASNEILVVHDEIDLCAGVARFKQDGGHGGHNGLRDIMAQLGTGDFLRLRIGVGHPGIREAVTPHVLGRPDADEQSLIEAAIARALSVMPEVFAGKLKQAMSNLNSVRREL